ncbi:hypothetical protein ZOSMA_25G00840 [Zostera marina]|uniref:Uncharacterized protein n=1 Tax=Zostera marina TaxID=29655 RepID=A0A0K9PHJ7_ZOSMR|nr:hypothetical protein ZOSMA_25G00840 [Zostera marina]
MAIIAPTTMATSITNLPCRIYSLTHFHRAHGAHVSIPIGAGRGRLLRLGLLHHVGKQHSFKVVAIKATGAQDDNEKEEGSEITTPPAEGPEFLNILPEPIKSFLKLVFLFLIGIWKKVQIASVVIERADEVAEKVEDFADKVGDAARELAEELPDDAAMKGVVLKVQNIAENIEEGADTIDNVLDKITDSIDDMEDKIEECKEEAENRKKEQDLGNAR